MVYDRLTKLEAVLRSAEKYLQAIELPGAAYEKDWIEQLRSDIRAAKSGEGE